MFQLVMDGLQVSTGGQRQSPGQQQKAELRVRGNTASVYMLTTADATPLSPEYLTRMFRRSVADSGLSRPPALCARGCTKTVWGALLGVAVGVTLLPSPFLSRHLTIIGALGPTVLIAGLGCCALDGYWIAARRVRGAGAASGVSSPARRE